MEIMGDDAEYLKALELQRKAFEQQFGSLEELGFDDKTKRDEDVDSEEEEDGEEEGVDSDEDSSTDDELSENESHSSEEEFKGFDEDIQKHKPQVIKFKDTTRSYTPPTKEELKILKSGKAAPTKPKVDTSQNTKQSKTSNPDENDDLKNDLELQRFLQESHILTNFQSENSGADLTLKTIDGIFDGTIGKARKYTLDSRLKDLSSINIVKKPKLEKMPMSMRKGMIKTRQEQISKFEQDAKDGGIILSKVRKGEFRNINKGSLSTSDRIGTSIRKKSNSRFREKGLKIQSVGKSTKNGLVISQREIDRINGSHNKGKGKKKGGRRR